MLIWYYSSSSTLCPQKQNPSFGIKFIPMSNEETCGDFITLDFLSFCVPEQCAITIVGDKLSKSYPFFDHIWGHSLNGIKELRNILVYAFLFNVLFWDWPWHSKRWSWLQVLYVVRVIWIAMTVENWEAQRESWDPCQFLKKKSHSQDIFIINLSQKCVYKILLRPGHTTTTGIRMHIRVTFFGKK